MPSSVLAPEIAHFSDLAASWWDKTGPFEQLHRLTPLREQYIKEQIAQAFSNKKGLCDLKILDVGCGGGLMSEALASQGAEIMGIDASPEAIEVAEAHHAEKEQNGAEFNLSYQCTTVEKLAQSGAQYDVVIALEILEHVADLSLFMKSLSSLVKPDGLLIMATLNRTKRSYLLAVVGAEYLLGWVPPGTHDWDRFISPSELVLLCEKSSLAPTDCTGMPYNPLSRQFKLEKGRVAVNYFMTALKVEKDTSEA